MSGSKIIDGLRDAVAGNFSRVTIEGQTWIRLGSEPEMIERAAAALHVVLSRTDPGWDCRALAQRAIQAALTEGK